MKTLFLILLLSLMIVNCSTPQGQQTLKGMTPGGFSYFRANYPECNQETTEGDWYNCINQMVEKEGRVR